MNSRQHKEIKLTDNLKNTKDSKQIFSVEGTNNS